MWSNFSKLIALSLLFVCVPVLADAPVAPPLTVEEEDGSPSAIPVYKIKVTNGTLTDNGDTSISLNTGVGTDATFNTVQAGKIGNVTPGDATFTYLTMSKVHDGVDAIVDVATIEATDGGDIQAYDGLGLVFKVPDENATGLSEVGGRIAFIKNSNTDTNSQSTCLIQTTADGTTYVNALAINSSGCVGIGNTLPGNALEVNGNIQCKTDGQKIVLGTSGESDSYLQYTGSDLEAYAAGDIYLNPTGNVGIGTATPAALLDVVTSEFTGARFKRDNSSGGAGFALVNANNNSINFGIGNGVTNFFVGASGGGDNFVAIDTSNLQVQSGMKIGWVSNNTDASSGTIDTYFQRSGPNSISTPKSFTAQDGTFTNSVGIGVTDPDKTLEVNGNMSALDSTFSTITCNTGGDNVFTGEVQFNDTNTGGNAGSDACIDANGKLCVCGSCA